MEKQFTKVEDIAHTALFKINGLATIQEAMNLMKEHKVSSLVIEKRSDADEYGFLTIQDIAKKVVAVNRSPERTSVYEIMSKPALTISGSMNIKYGIRLLSDLELTRALVQKDGELSGLVTLRDLVLAFNANEH